MLSRILEAFTYGNGLTEANTWTQDYELGRCQLFDGATTLVDRSLVRADALNLTGITDNVTAANSQTFGYSAANRLNAASGSYGTYSWSYDLVGNRTVEAVTPSGGALTTDTYAYPTTTNRIQTVTRGAATVRQMT